MLAETPFAILIVGTALLGLYLANLLYDFNVPQYISRKLGHLGGAVAFLLCPFLFETCFWPLILTAGFTFLLLYARLFRPQAFRGVGGSGRPEAMAEIHFPATGIVIISICWGLLEQPWLAIVPLCFMGAGDAVTGLIRSRVYGKEIKGNYGSVGMLITCLVLAYFIHPYWIGAAGAITATLAERFTKTRRYVDDNLTIPLSSAFVMTLLHTFVKGGLK